MMYVGPADMPCGVVAATCVMLGAVVTSFVLGVVSVRHRVGVSLCLGFLAGLARLVMDETNIQAFIAPLGYPILCWLSMHLGEGLSLMVTSMCRLRRRLLRDRSSKD